VEALLGAGLEARKWSCWISLWSYRVGWFEFGALQEEAERKWLEEEKEWSQSEYRDAEVTMESKQDESESEHIEIFVWLG
jgi:hypothetical protein